MEPAIRSKNTFLFICFLFVCFLIFFKQNVTYFIYSHYLYTAYQQYILWMYGKLGRGELSDSILCHYNHARGLRTQMGIILVLTRTRREASISFFPRKSSLNKGISNKEDAVKPKCAIHDVKTKFPFFMQGSALIKRVCNGSFFLGNLDP